MLLQSNIHANHTWTLWSITDDINVDRAFIGTSCERLANIAAPCATKLPQRTTVPTSPRSRALRISEAIQPIFHILDFGPWLTSHVVRRKWTISHPYWGRPRQNWCGSCQQHIPLFLQGVDFKWRSLSAISCRQNSFSVEALAMTSSKQPALFRARSRKLSHDSILLSTARKEKHE